MAGVCKTPIALRVSAGSLKKALPFKPMPFKPSGASVERKDPIRQRLSIHPANPCRVNRPLPSSTAVSDKNRRLCSTCLPASRQSGNPRHRVMPP